MRSGGCCTPESPPWIRRQDRSVQHAMNKTATTRVPQVSRFCDGEWAVGVMYAVRRAHVSGSSEHGHVWDRGISGSAAGQAVETETELPPRVDETRNSRTEHAECGRQDTQDTQDTQDARATWGQASQGPRLSAHPEMRQGL